MHGTAEYPLSKVQRVIWLNQLSRARSVNYNLGVALRLRGVVDVPRLQRCVGIVEDRNEALRTTLIPRGSEVAERVEERAGRELMQRRFHS
jgi:Condensation domain